jgi:Protein of unknown function (DUF2851)
LNVKVIVGMGEVLSEILYRAVVRSIGGVTRYVFAPKVPYEESEVARRWWSLPYDILLPLSQGGSCRVLFPGHPGGPAGPDVEDAVLQFAEERVTGSVEFHVCSSEWQAHHHHLDPRYNAVLLHVVLICDDPSPTMRQDKCHIPVCSLNDLVRSGKQLIWPVLPTPKSWPCRTLLRHLTEQERDKLLFDAGMLRFEEKTHRFVEQLHTIDVYDGYEAYNACLIPALAEGLGYGRDRELFRAIGMRLVGLSKVLPEPLGWSDEPSPLDVLRLRALVTLIERWRVPGVWQTLHRLLLSSGKTTERRNATAQCLMVLRASFCQTGLSLARTDILICNVVLPFAAAVALLEHQQILAERVQLLYRTHPGLVSNRITRIMCEQLQLPTEPKGSCRQQGLHYVYQHTCRSKQCEFCLLGKKDI